MQVQIAPHFRNWVTIGAGLMIAAGMLVFPAPADADGKRSRIGRPEAFVPAGWTIVYQTPGDLNHDGRADLVLVIDPPGEEGDDRLLLILEARRDGRFTFAASVSEIALCRRCGGAFGDPGMDPEIKGGVLSVGNYGGSAWKWSVSYGIEKIDGEYRLTSYESTSFHSLKECEGTSLKFTPLTGEVVLAEEKMKDGECDEQEQRAQWKPRGGFLLKERDSWALPHFTNLWKK